LRISIATTTAVTPNESAAVSGQGGSSKRIVAAQRLTKAPAHTSFRNNDRADDAGISVGLDHYGRTLLAPLT